MDLSVYLERIRSSVPNIDFSQASLIDEGMQFAVVIADGWVFRFARDEWAIQSLGNEARVLELLRSRVRLTIPQFEYLELDWCAYRFLPGAPLTFQAWQRFDRAGQVRIMRQLGEFIRELHGTPTQGQHLAQSGAARTREDWLAFYRNLEQELFPKLMRFQREAATALFAPVLEDRLSFDHAPTLVDGDISVYHLLHDPDTRALTAKIDFGITGVGDPAVDLACVLMNYGERGAAHVLKVYPEAHAFLERARFWAGTLEWQWAYYGLKRTPESLLWAHLGTARDLRLPL